MSKMDFSNWASGISIVRSLNGNFNADITRTPRTLPDKAGTIYATDKVLKYCIRSYLVNVKKEKVFMWRRNDQKDKERKPLSIDENYANLFGVISKTTPREDILKNLLTCIDVRLFGCTYADKVNEKNVAIHGTAQISYGVNALQENGVHSNQILSPFRNPSEKKVDATQTTMGEESKALDVCYVYDYNINPNNIDANSETRLTEEDVETFKGALRNGVNSVNTTTKIGSETLLVLHTELKKPKMLQNLKKFVKISKNDSATLTIDITDLVNYLKKFDDDIVQVQLFYEKEKTNLTYGEKWSKIEESDLLAG